MSDRHSKKERSRQINFETILLFDGCEEMLNVFPMLVFDCKVIHDKYKVMSEKTFSIVSHVVTISSQKSIEFLFCKSTGLGKTVEALGDAD